MILRAATLSIALTVCLFQGAWCTTLYVDGSVSASGDGTSWATAFKTIQEGIDTASNSDTVMVAQGTYVENILFKGKNIVLRSTNPSDANVVAATIIDGNKSGPVVTLAGTEGATCVLSGFTIRNGKADYGGGIYGGASQFPPRAAIKNNVITGNSANANGGGVFWCDGTIENNRICGNSAQNGAGLSACGGTIQNNLIINNRCPGWGGGVHWCAGIIQNNLIAGNSGSQAGGMYSCNNTIQNNVIIGNSGGYGGGLNHCGATIRNNAIIGNSAEWAGGGLCDCGGKVANNTIVGNAATSESGEGAGLWLCTGTILNCIVWGNTASQGAQLSLSSDPSYSCIQNWTGGGENNISQNPLFVGKPVFTGTWTADATFDPQTCQTTLVNGSASWQASALVGLPINPDVSQPLQFIIAFNSATTIKVWGDASGFARAGDAYEVNNYRLSGTSPCIDRGQNETWMSGALDLDGNPRIVWGISSLTVDMGAYEAPDSVPPVITLIGANPMTLQVGTPYAEPGYTATDNGDEDLTANVVVSGSVNHTVVGSYTLRYNVSDSSGNPAIEKTRSVNVVTDVVPPVITLLGSNPMTIAVGTPYVEPGYTASDDRDGDITARVVVSGSVNHSVVGTYSLRYNVSDSAGNPAPQKTKTVNVVDTISPVITLLGPDIVTLQVGSPYSEPGYSASDNYDGNITSRVVVTGSVNHAVVGSYTLRYNVSDSSGNPAQEKARTVNVVDTTPPIITLLGENPMTLEVGAPYVEPGYTAADNYDGDITASVSVTGSVNQSEVGSYTLRYNVSDSCGNPAQEKVRTVTVMDTVPPIIALLGDNVITLEAGTPYDEPGYAATDNYDGDITANVVVTGSVDCMFLASYALKYNVKDSCGNPAQEKTRVVNVVDTTPPVISLLGDNPITLEVGAAYVEPGYTATDNCDGDVSADVVVAGSVNHAVPGSYTLHYNLSDWSGNPAEEKTRRVNVVDTAPPVITLLGDDSVTLEVGTPYTEPGYSANDDYDGDITANVIVTGSVDETVVGTYLLRYNVSDSSGNPAEEKVRRVNVVDTAPPVITLLGDDSVTLEVGTPYTEPGYSANDDYDGDITANVIVTPPEGGVDHTVVGTYLLRYNVSDSSGNPAEEKVRRVNVVDTAPPVVTLLGDDSVTLEVGTPYTEPGYSANDDYDGDITANVTVTGSVDHTVVGTYLLRYNVSDSSGNPAEEKTRTIGVVSTGSVAILEIVQNPDGSVQLIWKNRPGATYAVWSSAELATGTWNEEATVTTNDVQATWTDHDAACLHKFYRIEAR